MAAKPAFYDAIILGAGGAGLMCAAMAGQRGRKVLLLDHADKPGKKILISGGGRCNFTNINTTPANYLSANQHFAKSALRRYTAQDFLKLVERHKIDWHEKTLGQLFCDGSAKQIVNLLLDECSKGGVELRLNEAIGQINHADNQYSLNLADGAVTAPSLVIATGGPSIPKMGATGIAYDIARQFGLKIVEPRPALVPLTLGGQDVLFQELSGVSAKVTARCGRNVFQEAALFTHKGLSGPAILQISSYWRHGQEIGINFLPDNKTGWLVEAKHANPRANLKTVLSQLLAGRLAETLSEKLSDKFKFNVEIGNLPDKKLLAAEATLQDWLFKPTGTEGFAKAEVTIGGISTKELSSQTMQANKVPGLFAIGEAVDVTGWLGGYNFQWAWSSGWAAAQAL